MNDIEHSEPRRPSPLPKKPRMPDLSAVSWIPVIAAFLLIALPLFIWFGCRIEPRSGGIAVLIRKTGKDLPSGQILAMNPKEKGIQLEVLPEGRYFRNPYTWGWKIHGILDIPAGKLGVKTRLYGDPLPVGKIIAPEGYKGVMSDVLRPGKYRINPYAYTVDLADAITIRPGHVGVVTSLIGEDVLDSELSEDVRNTFLVKEGLKGVLPGVLDPGSYYVNPYVVSIVEVNLQSQRFEMSGDDVITFLTFDGFTVTVEGTIEYVLERDNAALLTHRVGDMEDIIKKVILPRARGFSRIEGSKHPAINFIVGETRQKFQNDLEAHLREKCNDWGAIINSVLIRRIIVPDEIASIIREREIAVQDAIKYDQQIIQAKSKAELVKQEMLAVQNKEKVEADTVRIAALINARQDQRVRIIAAEQELDVAKLDNEAAAFRAEAVLSRAAGDKDAIEAKNLAEAAVVASEVSAFGNGMNLARYRFYEKIAPQIGSVLSSDRQQGLGTIFGPLLPEGKGGAQ